MLIISNRPRATCSADLKSLAPLLSELYSTQSYYHYLSHLKNMIMLLGCNVKLQTCLLYLCCHYDNVRKIKRFCVMFESVCTVVFVVICDQIVYVPVCNFSILPMKVSNFNN